MLLFGLRWSDRSRRFTSAWMFQTLAAEISGAYATRRIRNSNHIQSHARPMQQWRGYLDHSVIFWPWSTDCVLVSCFTTRAYLNTASTLQARAPRLRHRHLLRPHATTITTQLCAAAATAATSTVTIMKMIMEMIMTATTTTMTMMDDADDVDNDETLVARIAKTKS